VVSENHTTTDDDGEKHAPFTLNAYMHPHGDASHGIEDHPNDDHWTSYYYTIDVSSSQEHVVPPNEVVPPSQTVSSCVMLSWMNHSQPLR